MSSVYTTVHTADTTISTATNLVCPFVADIAADSTLNVTSETVATVTINNIDQSFEASSADLAAAFDCSGWGINRTDSQYEELIGGLVVDLSGSLLKTILTNALVNAKKSMKLDGENANGDHGLNAYLESEMRYAFRSAFPDYVSLYDLSGVDALFVQSPAANPGNNASASGTAGASKTGATDVSYNRLPTASVFRQQSVVNSFGVSVDVSGAAAAEAMVNGLGSNTNYLQSLFMQLPIQNLRNYVDSSGNKNTSYLPLAENDSITFVWDITVNASTDPNTSNAPATGTQVPGTSQGPNAANGTSSDGGAGTQAADKVSQANNQGPISMDLGTRRIAIVIKQSGAAAGEQLPSGGNLSGSVTYTPPV